MISSIPWPLLLFRFVIGIIVVGVSPYLILVSRDTIEPAGVVQILVGVMFSALGLFAYFKSIWDFTHFEPTRVIASGAYRFVRNPMYAALILILAGETGLTALPALTAYTATIWLALHLLVVLVEEPAMSRRYGAQYETYRAEVPRWLPRAG